MKIFLILLISLILYNCVAIDAVNLSKNAINGSSPDNIGTLIIEPPYEVNGKWFYPKKYRNFNQIGLATQIVGLEVGAKTSNGERYHPDVSTGAHASLAMPSMVSVTNLSNGFTTNVRINHRGGFSNINTIKLSPAVFKLIDLQKEGGLVEINLISQNESFVLKEAKTFSEEKKVENAPLSEVSVETISLEKESNIAKETSKIRSNVYFKELSDEGADVYLNIARFSFEKSAISFKNGLNIELDVKIIETFEENKTLYNVVIGPFDNIQKLINIQKNDIFKLYEDLSLSIL